MKTHGVGEQGPWPVGSWPHSPLYLFKVIIYDAHYKVARLHGIILVYECSCSYFSGSRADVKCCWLYCIYPKPLNTGSG